MNSYLLKLKHYSFAIQYTYSKITCNRKFYPSLKQKKSNIEEINRCSYSRSISLIKEYCFSNDFDYFFTFTLKSKKRNNTLFAFNLINSKFDYYKKKYNDFSYIYVFEKQKKGGLHVHGFIRGLKDLYINDNGHLSSKYFDKLGFQCYESIEKVNPFYLIKYITKEPIKELKHRFYRSKDLKKADVSYLHCNFDEFKDFPFTFKSNFCKMITIPK